MGTEKKPDLGEEVPLEHPQDPVMRQEKESSQKAGECVGETKIWYGKLEECEAGRKGSNVESEG